MRAIAKTEPAPGHIREVEVAEPTLGPGQVLLRVRGGGLCGTDLAIRRWDADIAAEYAPSFPHVLGHEFAGRVEAVATDVAGIAVGAQAVVNPHVNCGRCFYCNAGRHALCLQRRIMGCHAPGGLTECIAVPADNVFVLPDGTDPLVAAVIEPLTVATHAALERVPMDAGDVALVMGAGPVGLLHLLVARAAGAAEVIVAGVAADADRLALARRLGAVTVDQESEDLLAAVRRVAPRGADVAYDASGHPAALAAALPTLRRGGRLAVVGYCHAAAPFHSLPLALDEKEIFGCRAYNRGTWVRSTALSASLASELRQLVTHVLPFGEIDRAFSLLERRECMKVVVEPEGNG
ncbi:MAG: alcohol dehydrogenase catalytic domain-containing protein [Alphaproteobacteria bacterium]|jgi:2-desacetyl-2-hydroxyethyl bacteriochlorophyllide A dehydrogenase|nr:alcohol dehydrogenase catalytic domain-containing protein [Alphaproteobacteria bacterium]MDP6564746.1 alcohol dehydrogenase catalytic domain-containing protein [Alphaproteobacteria bacterium]MDP6815461.1 alcohol dehydrogenase catalytic domain-containing protein [Alphaproteobacteria bacterium]